MSQQQQPGQGDDQEIAKIFIFSIISLIILFALLATQENRINAFIGAVSWIHIAPFAYLAKYVPFLLEIPLMGPFFFEKCLGALTYLEYGAYAYMDSEGRSYVLTASGRAATVIYGGLLIWIALKGTDFRVDTKFKTRHSLESMIWLQSDMWLTSRLARHINPLKGKEVSARVLAEAAAKKVSSMAEPPGLSMPRGHVAIQPGTWNRALRPEEWLIASGLSFNPKRYGQLKAGDGIIRDMDFEFRQEWINLHLETLSEVLGEQLRTPWQGVEKLRPVHKAAYAVMAMFYAYNIDGGNKLLNDIGVLADLTKGKPGSLDKVLMNEKGMMARIEKTCYGNDGKKLAMLGKYSAWAESAFPVFLAASRKDRGVLPPAAFLWMKAEDRLMWYVMNNVGNEAISIEAAGAIAHARAEQQVQKKIRRPAVYQAARAMLEDYLDMTKERIVARADKEVRSRTPGAQMDLIRDSILQRSSE